MHRVNYNLPSLFSIARSIWLPSWQTISIGYPNSIGGGSNSPTPSSPELSVALRVGSLRFLPSVFVCLLVLSLFGSCVGSHTAVLRHCGWSFPAVFRRHNSQQTLWVSPLLQCSLSFRYRTYIAVLSIYGAWRLHDGLFSALWPAVAFCDRLFLLKRSFFGEGWELHVPAKIAGTPLLN